MKPRGIKTAAAAIFFALTLMPFFTWRGLPWVTEAYAETTAQNQIITSLSDPQEAEVTVKLVIKWKLEANDFTVTCPSSPVYDGNPKTASVSPKGDIPGLGEITVEYYKGGTKVGQPVDVGDYTFKIIVAEGELNKPATLDAPAWKFSIVKAKPSVTAPSAKTGLKANGSAQALVNKGNAAGGTMYYAKSANGNSAPSSGWATAIPTGTDAGTYYVWYKVTGDKNHTNIDPAVVSVTIAKKDEPKKDPPKEDPPKENLPKEDPPKKDPPKKETPPAKPKKKTDVSILLNAHVRLSWKDSKVEFKWGNAPGVDTYEVWMAYCGKPLKKVLSVKNANKIEIEEIQGKKLNKKRSVKAYVIAYRNGSVIGQSLDCHSAGSKCRYTNAKKVKTSKNTYKMQVGDTVELKAKAVKKKKGKPFLKKKHCARLRYASSDPSIAVVDAKGTVTAKKAGTCKVWAYAQNGRSKKVTVIVE